MEYQPRQIPQRNGSDPKKENVTQHQEFRIPAGTKHAFGENGVHGLENNDDDNRIHQLKGDGFCLGGNFVVVDNGGAQKEDNQRSHATDDKTEEQEGVALPLRLFVVTFAHGVACDDTACVGNALCKYRAQLLHHRSHRVSRHKGLADSAHDHSDGVVAQSQQRIGDQHRNADAEILSCEIAAACCQIAKTVCNAAIDEKEVTADETKLKYAGNQGAQRRTGDFHTRGAQMTEDEDPVEEDIDEKGENRAGKRNLDLADTAEDNGTSQGKPHAVVGGDHPAQIGGAVCNDFGITRGVDRHDPLGGGDSNHGKGGGKDKKEPQHDGNCFFEGVIILHSPETGSEDVCPHTDAHAANLKQGDKLSRQGRGGQLSISHFAEHDGVHEVDSHGDQRLQGNGNGNFQHLSIKRPIAQIVFNADFFGQCDLSFARNITPYIIPRMGKNVKSIKKTSLLLFVLTGKTSFISPKSVIYFIPIP